MKLLLLLILSTSIVACSGAKSTQDVGAEDTGIELTDSEEITDEFETAAEDVVAEEVGENNPVQVESSPVAVNAGEEQEYTVGKNETLMMIAFKLYGDYGKWKDLSDYNQLKSNKLSQGQKIKYIAPEVVFEWNPQGNPYLIKKQDTLGLISDKTYGTTKEWKNIWENNKPLIKDPNKIFAGFTIYTPILEREVASK